MWREALHDLARQQHGVIARSQAIERAPSVSAARNELGRPHWVDLGGGLRRLRGSTASKWQRSMTAVLRGGPGAAVSHHTSVVLWGLPGSATAPTHITTARRVNSRGDDTIVVHRTRRLYESHITTLKGIPITRPERIPFDLANIGVPGQRVERILDQLWSDRLVSGRSLRRMQASLPKQGFRGTVLMRDLLEQRPDDWIPPASGLEGRVMAVLDQAGYADVERQLNIGDDEWIGRVDFVDRKRRIVIEVQSERHHAALSSRRDDQARFARLRDAGFAVVEVWENDVWHRPHVLLDQLRTVHH